MNIEDIKDKLNLDNHQKIEEALSYCKQLYDDEEDRRKTIEAKATSLIATTSITAAFSIGFISIIIKDTDNLNFILLLISLLFFIFITILLIWSNICAIRAVYIKEYRITQPNPSDIFNLKDKTIACIKNERAIDYYYSFLMNEVLNNKKADWTIKAQRHLRNALIILLPLIITIAINITISNKYFKNIKVIKNLINCSETLSI
ncbi:hypothetical protein [Desulfobacca acetoxidans]